jgi:hypothetical protein
MSDWIKTEFGARRQKPGSPYGEVRPPWAAQPQPKAAPQAPVKPEPKLTPVEWLKSILAEGPKPSVSVIALAKARGIGRKGLLKAQKRLGIKPTQSARTWFWALPGQSDD